MPQQSMTLVIQVIFERMRKRQWQDSNLPHYPTTWDINNGFCEEWGEEVAKRLPGAETGWADEFESNEITCEASHYIVKYQGKFYDAECVNGVASVMDLPLFQNRNKSRSQVLIERNMDQAC